MFHIFLVEHHLQSNNLGQIKKNEIEVKVQQKGLPGYNEPRL
jgi:hypothetical protein